MIRSTMSSKSFVIPMTKLPNWLLQYTSSSRCSSLDCDVLSFTLFSASSNASLKKFCAFFYVFRDYSFGRLRFPPSGRCGHAGNVAFYVTDGRLHQYGQLVLIISPLYVTSTALSINVKRNQMTWIGQSTYRFRRHSKLSELQI